MSRTNLSSNPEKAAKMRARLERMERGEEVEDDAELEAMESGSREMRRGATIFKTIRCSTRRIRG